MKFGIGLPAVTPTAAVRWDRESVNRAVAEVARKADALGYDFVTACDHIVIPEANRRLIGPRWYDAVATLSYVAAMTSRVRLLTSVVVLPYRNPFTIAKSIATLDVLSRGRVIFGVGVGHLKPEFEALKVPYQDRGPMTDECIRIIKRLWTEDSVTYEGRYYQCRDVVLEPKPVQKPLPIWIGGNSKLAVKRAVTMAEGWTPFSLPPEEFQEGAGYGQRLAMQTGRKEPLALVAPIGPVLRHEDAAPRRSPEEVERRVQEAAGDSRFYRDILSRNLASIPLTSAEEMAGRIEKVRAAGATHCNVGFRYRELSHYLEAMEWFAGEVMPRFA